MRCSCVLRARRTRVSSYCTPSTHDWPTGPACLPACLSVCHTQIHMQRRSNTPRKAATLLALPRRVMLGLQHLSLRQRHRQRHWTAVSAVNRHVGLLGCHGPRASGRRVSSHSRRPPGEPNVAPHLTFLISTTPDLDTSIPTAAVPHSPTPFNLWTCTPAPVYRRRLALAALLHREGQVQHPAHRLQDAA